jgi:hypothetical protein
VGAGTCVWFAGLLVGWADVAAANADSSQTNSQILFIMLQTIITS